jgi:hypothetical protein
MPLVVVPALNNVSTVHHISFPFVLRIKSEEKEGYLADKVLARLL